MHVQLTETGMTYQGTELSFAPSYQETIALFDENDIYMYNDRCVQATSDNKCIVNEATKTIRIPLGHNSFLQYHWHRDLSKPLTTKIFYQNINQYWPAITYSYDDLVQQCEQGQISLQIHSAAPLAGKAIQTLNVNKTTTIQDVLKVFTRCNAEYKLFHDMIVFTDGMFDKAKCSIQIKWEDDNTIQSISLYPNYPFDLDIFGSTTQTAKLCRNKMLEEIKLQPQSNVIRNDSFALVYDFDTIKLSTSLSYTPRDGYPEWSGITVYFM